MPEKNEIADLLESISDMMEFKGENKFKILAFRNGAAAIKKSDENIDAILAQKRLDQIKGIGKGLQSVIYEFAETGESSLYNDLKKDVPDGIEELLNVKGLGAKKIYQLYTDLGITNLEQLESACRENKLASIKGFGAATQKKILTGIEQYRHNSKFVLLNAGLLFAEEFQLRLSDFASILKISMTGEIRRRSEIISAISFVLLVKSVADFKKEISGKFDFEIDKSILSIKNYYSVPVNLLLTSSEDEFAKVLFLTTGSDSFLAGLNADLNKAKGATETAVFKSLKVPYIIPEMREEEFLKHNKLSNGKSGLDLAQFKGLLHFHSTYSDGRNSLAEMINTAEKKGFEYAAICDHSKSAFYANGLKEERVRQQHLEVDELNKQIKIKIFKGIEADILEDGSLDFVDDFLNEFDFVVASVHSRFSLDEAAMTKRLIKAVENPHTDLLGHPSGRLLLSREPYKLNVKKVIDACAANNVAIEINSNPRRLDLDWRNIYYARQKNCIFSINPDAHSIGEIDLIKYGIMMGRKGGLEAEEVINCYPLEKFIKYLKRKLNRNI